MLRLLILCAILGVATVQGQIEPNCTDVFYTVNTYETRNSFTFSCYGVDSDCEVFYTPEGNGCNGDLGTAIGTIPRNETQVLTSETDFERGGGFCSRNEIGVFHVDEEDNILAHLPRETDRGTKFFLGASNSTGSIRYLCALYSVFRSPTSARIDFYGGFTLLNFGSYRSSFEYDLSINEESTRLMEVTADFPVVVSCVSLGSQKRMITLQQMSPERLLLATSGNSIVTVTLSDCLTEEVVEDFSRVSLESISDNGALCGAVKIDSGDLWRSYFFNGQCTVLVQARDGICASATRQSTDYHITAFGIPESKLSMQFVHYGLPGTYDLFSYSETPCTGYMNPTSAVIFDKEWMKGALDGVVARNFSVSSFDAFSWTECAKPTLMVKNEVSGRYPFLSGNRSRELLNQFARCTAFANITPAMTSAPLDPPSAPSAPSPSDSPDSRVPSLIPCLCGFAFFWFYLFSPSLA